jgi:starch synthase
MRLFFVSAELSPLCQSGGLGEAVGGLARALGARGHQVTCVLPGHRMAFEQARGLAFSDGGELRLALPDGGLVGRWREAGLGPNLRVALIDLPALYDRPRLYGDAAGDYPDNALRFCALGRAGAWRAAAERADALVAHDWHAALAVATLRWSVPPELGRSIATVQVIHNNAYQGKFPASAMALTELPPELYRPEGLEAWGSLCLLKAGIVFADRIVAVSPTYAREIQQPGFGAGLEGVYRARADALLGIANGIDAERYDPAHDGALAETFSSKRLSGKERCRDSLLHELELAAPAPGRLCVALGRLTEQKGWGVLADALEALVARGASLALLGDGDPAIAARLADAAATHPRRIALRLGYDEGLARRLYAGADQVLVPSRFEPCGLVQLLAQRYGALPVAHRVGGLADTIEDGRTGFLFEPLDADALVGAFERAAALAEGDVEGLREVQRRLLDLDVSWATPAAHWEALLESLVRERRG